MNYYERIDFFVSKLWFITVLFILATSEKFWFHWYLYTGFNTEKTIERIKTNKFCPHTVLQLWIDYKVGNW